MAIDELRVATWASAATLVVFPFATIAWVSGPWWAWWLVVPMAAVGAVTSWWALKLVREETWLDEQDRKVWRGWLLTAGGLATPFVLHQIRRADERRRAR